MGEEWSEERRQAVADFQVWMEGEDMTQRQAARLLHIHPSTLSQVLKGSYEGRVGRICDRIRRVLRRAYLRDQVPDTPPFARTGIADAVTHALGLAHVEGGIVVVAGPTGIGKTTAVKRYAEQEPGTIYVVAGTHSSP